MKGKMFGMMAAAGSMQRQVEWGIAPFTSADISVELAEVSFLTAEDYGIEMVWADERIKPNYKVSNGKLTVFTPEYGALRLRNAESGQFIVYLPKTVDRRMCNAAPVRLRSPGIFRVT